MSPLFVDCYSGDGPKDWREFAKAGPPWHGAVLKATQGTYYNPSWLVTERRALLLAMKESGRYGVDLFEGVYHYLDLANDGKRQADYCMAHLAKAGGEQAGTLPLMVDVERGGQSVVPTRQRVLDCVGPFAERYTELTGRKATLYGGELLRAVSVGGLMGCGRSAVALYGPELHGSGESTEQFLARTGTTLGQLMFWQYCGDGVRGLKGYPNTAPGCGRIDISTLLLPGGLDAVRALLPAPKVLGSPPSVCSG